MCVYVSIYLIDLNYLIYLSIKQSINQMIVLIRYKKGNRKKHQMTMNMTCIPTSA